MEKEFEGLAYPGQQEEDEFRETAHVQARLEQKKAPAYPTRELVPVTREEAAARKKVTANYYKVCIILYSYLWSVLITSSQCILLDCDALCNVFQDEKEAVYHTTNHKVCADTVRSTVYVLYSLHSVL